MVGTPPDAFASGRFAHPTKTLAASGLGHGHLRTTGNRPVPGGTGCVLNDLAFAGRFRRAGQLGALLDIHLRVGPHPGIVRGIFPAVDRRHMWRIPAEIWSSDSEFLAVGIDPFPEFFRGGPSLVSCRAVDAHDIGCKPVAVAAAKTSAMV